MAMNVGQSDGSDKTSVSVATTKTATYIICDVAKPLHIEQRGADLLEASTHAEFTERDEIRTTRDGGERL